MRVRNAHNGSVKRTHSSPQGTHTIFGAGQVGLLLARELLFAGHRVRLVRRGEAGRAQPRLTWMRGDVTDATFAGEACAGADVVYDCTNPAAYHRWPQLLPALRTAVRMAATRARARLVVLDNLYMYGRPTSEPFDEGTPHRPCSRKGELRARLHGELFDAHRRGDVRVTCGHASDFFGPGAVSVAVFMPRLFERLARGKSLDMLGDASMPHSYSYTPDVARGLALLGTHQRSEGRSWHLPVAHRGSTRELVERFAAHMGVAPRLRHVPTWVLRAGGVFVPVLGAVAEMAYQWESPFLVDDGRFRAAFGVQATPIQAAVRVTAHAFTTQCMRAA